MELKPCPFCGGKAVRATHIVHCENLEYCGAHVAPNNTDHDVEELWNSRK